MVFSISEQLGRDPFLVLISCLLSLRTKDTVTFPASMRLFEYARTPEQLLKLPILTIEKLIYPVGFYHRKALLMHSVSKDLLDRFGGKVPGIEEDLLSIKGVGRKTANLVLGEGFGIPAICVDTHVHRVANRLGLVETQTPEQTETELKKIIPKDYWIRLNQWLVVWGQQICVPISPFCSKCPLRPVCKRVGVTKSR
ncbi:endonuclease III [Candidatus Dependentiae bacterium]|nr:endonuclease III [Candidatus Dependentiae bacterium]